MKSGAFSVTLIESPDIRIIGVGEGTWPTMRASLERTGVSETELFRHCDASFKQGGKFARWTTGTDDDAYYHPLMLPQGFSQLNLVPHWFREGPRRSFCDFVSPQGRLCDEGLAPKTITSAEGGMVTTRDGELYRRLLEFRTHGMTRDPARLEREEGGWYMEQQSLGYNYRLSDIHAALGVAQMRKLEAFIERRNALAARYAELLGDLEALQLAPEAGPGERHGRHLYVIRHRGGAPARRRLYDGLREHAAFAQVHYLPVYLHPWYRETYSYAAGLCPAAEEYYAGCLSLPCYPSLTDEQQDIVVAAVREFI